MIDLEKILIVIPARGGSKRIPDKNIKNIASKPMIHWPLNELLKVFPKKNILISTDSEKIKKVVNLLNIEIPFTRPEKLSDDYIGINEVLYHALDWYEANINRVEFVILVYPTSVLLKHEDILNAYDKLRKESLSDQILSVTNFPFPIERAVIKDKNGFMKMIYPENYNKRSQDFIETFHDAGQFSIYRSEALRERKEFNESKVIMHLLDRENAVDIDNIEDFKIAEKRLMYREYFD